MKNNDIHPLLIDHRRNITRSKIGDMMIDIVKRSGNIGQDITVTGITKLCRSYNIHTDTLHRYIGERIFPSSSWLNNTKILYISRNEVIAIRELVHIIGRYQGLTMSEKKIIKTVILSLWRNL